MTESLHPAVALLREYSRRYPHAWDQYAGLLADRAELGDWPPYVYCPIAGAYAVVSGGGDRRVPLDRLADVGVLGALAAWRPTQGIYRYDSALLDALWSTPLDGQIPVEHLRHLPEWCVYVELPGRRVLGDEIVGAWAHIEVDAGDRREELRLVLLGADGVALPIPLHLRGGTIERAIGLMLDEGSANLALHAAGPVPALPDRSREIAREIAPVISTLLYLCTTEAEVRDARGTDRRPTIPSVRRDKRGRPRVYGAQDATTWETGYRLGAALRRAQEAAERSTEGEEAGRTVTPHVRRAHWHTVLSGPRDRERRRDLRWYPPIAVGLDDAPELAVVRPVRPPE